MQLKEKLARKFIDKLLRSEEETDRHEEKSGRKKIDKKNCRGNRRFFCDAKRHCQIFRNIEVIIETGEDNYGKK